MAFAELSKIVLGAEPLNVTLERIAVLARATMPEVDEVSMTLLEDGKAKTAVFTGPLATQLDERHDTGFGPASTPRSAAKQSWWTLATARVLTLISPRQSAGCGVTYSVSVGLPVPERLVGAMNLYALTDQPLEGETVTVRRPSPAMPQWRWPTPPCTPVPPSS